LNEFLPSLRVGGTLRTTTSTPDNRNTAKARLSFANTEEENEYDKNIQVADLNALNATLATIRWKKLRGFYFDFTQERYSRRSTTDSSLVAVLCTIDTLGSSSCT
jgi:hypothetical protein